MECGADCDGHVLSLEVVELCLFQSGNPTLNLVVINQE
jgi:hypothetical protein